MLKEFNDVFSGWGAFTGTSEVGFEGYSYEDAQSTASGVIAQMNAVPNIRTVRVSIEKMGNGKFKVVNRSTYEEH